MAFKQYEYWTRKNMANLKESQHPTATGHQPPVQVGLQSATAGCEMRDAKREADEVKLSLFTISIHVKKKCGAIIL
jgi:hypothetical protein